MIQKALKALRKNAVPILLGVLVLLQLVTWFELTRLPHYVADSCGNDYYTGCWLRDDDIRRLAVQIGEQVASHLSTGR